MFKSPVRDRTRQQGFWIVALVAVAIGLCGWSVLSYIRRAPIQSRIDQGVQLQLQGRDTDAEREWQKAVALDASNVQAWELLGDSYLKVGAFPQANDAFDHLFTLAPNTPDLHARMAIAAYQLHDNERARRQAGTELKNNPNSIAALQILVKADKDIHTDQVLANLRQLVQLQPQDVTALTSLIDELHYRDAYDQIIPLTDQLVKLTPNSADSYLQRGVALYVTNSTSDSLERARKDLQRALQLDPSQVDAHRYLGRIYMRENKLPLAIMEFEAVGRGRPYASAHLLELSQAYRRAGKVQRADELQARFVLLRELNTQWINLSDRIKREPKNIDNYTHMALLLIQQGVGADPSPYYLYSFQVGGGKLQNIQWYLDTARQKSASDTRIQKAQQQVDAVFNRYLEMSEQTLRSRQYAKASDYVARCLLIKPGDARTQKLARQVMGAGFDPFPKYDPTAAPRLHTR